MDYKIKEKDEWDKMKEFLNKNKMIGVIILIKVLYV